MPEDIEEDCIEEKTKSDSYPEDSVEARKARYDLKFQTPVPTNVITSINNLNDTMNMILCELRYLNETLQYYYEGVERPKKERTFIPSEVK